MDELRSALIALLVVNRYQISGFVLGLLICLASMLFFRALARRRRDRDDG
ncbi:hypothetical protein [Ancylobacter mangrovi]|nr:hypothetical protein [Ancylobacter mangrovi]MCS0501568.1 hypothetical protein [Ancylobacter mangrovi]